LNRKRLLLSSTFAIVIFLASNFALVFATDYPVTYTEIETAFGDFKVDVPDQPQIWMSVQKFDADSSHGARDRLWVRLLNPVTNVWVTVAVASDGSEESGDFFNELWAGMGGGQVVASYRSVDPEAIHIYRIGKLVLAAWTQSFEGVIPASLKTALGKSPDWEWTLLPGIVVLKGYGEVDTTSGGMGPLPSGYTITTEPNLYDARGTFICPCWRFGGRVYEATTGYRVLTVSHP
jgi:hypothetical protein